MGNFISNSELRDSAQFFKMEPAHICEACTRALLNLSARVLQAFCLTAKSAKSPAMFHLGC